MKRFHSQNLLHNHSCLRHAILHFAGSSTELLAHNGIYARLWAHQSGGFLGLED